MGGSERERQSLRVQVWKGNEGWRTVMKINGSAREKRARVKKGVGCKNR